ncbi:hypothetical protein [Sporolactobacillus terrae]|uniref:Polymer-forming cytoskeletal protein n=1 Tax=Sporolactobacillus terrae TaxID=269673 RepID=A0ABX5QB69_9BACL|nr:hypothetical protein [Sporolactobacillus terrae]QAA23831.1 hypothetical protein C0674_15220 [Sporolactobacillus terrae]QAA26802.1 hypothetical protein C0679_15205 [Sporolactobacillus terrae]UAK15865.1 hypothetical protein K7399_12750 [Sporolactobacillus terrae]
MSQATGKDLKIMGETQSNGGQFDKVRTMGECTITGSVEADSCKVMGECSISGDLSCTTFKNMGEVAIGGSLAAKQARLIGTNAGARSLCVAAVRGLRGTDDCAERHR